MSNPSLQVCQCGWSKVTTYHGLRTHQGMKGCMQRGNSAPLSGFSNLNTSFSQTTTLPKFDLSNATTRDQAAGTSLQVCHCGWSKVTTYQGLRTHQGIKGCTPMGTKIPSSGLLNINASLSQTPTRPVSEYLMSPNDITVFQTPQPPAPSAKEFLPVQRKLDFSPNVPDQTETQSINRQPQSKDRQQHPVTQPKEQPRSMENILQLSTDMLNNMKTPLQTNISSPTQQVNLDQMAELQLKLAKRWKQLADVRSSAKSFQVSLDCEWIKINSVFSEVMRVVEEARLEALRPLEETRANAKKEAEDLILDLQGEIDQLRTAIKEENVDVQVSTIPTTASVYTSSYLGSMQTITSAMMESIRQELEKLSPVELQRLKKTAVDVKLDPHTAHPSLHLSADGKEVSDAAEHQGVPDSPQRFDLFSCVLGGDSVVPGKSYWEVEVGEKKGWDLGVARENANRKGMLSLNPASGFWAVVHYEGKHYAALTEPPSRILLSVRPQRVGVFVDRDEGLISFYDAEAQRHIYSFTGCVFDGELLPYFSPHRREEGQNTESLIICAVTEV